MHNKLKNYILAGIMIGAAYEGVKHEGSRLKHEKTHGTTENPVLVRLRDIDYTNPPAYNPDFTKYANDKTYDRYLQKSVTEQTLTLPEFKEYVDSVAHAGQRPEDFETVKDIITESEKTVDLDFDQALTEIMILRSPVENDLEVSLVKRRLITRYEIGPLKHFVPKGL